MSAAVEIEIRDGEGKRLKISASEREMENAGDHVDDMLKRKFVLLLARFHEALSPHAGRWRAE